LDFEDSTGNSEGSHAKEKTPPERGFVTGPGKPGKAAQHVRGQRRGANSISWGLFTPRVRNRKGGNFG
jgi:hypothetical protein